MPLLIRYSILTILAVAAPEIFSGGNEGVKFVSEGAKIQKIGENG